MSDKKKPSARAVKRVAKLSAPAAAPEVAEAIPPTETESKAPKRFPIVGIGSSAGGLEALKQFLTHVPKKSGIGFVIIQHLDPEHKGMMPEILQRDTPMKVLQAIDQMKIEPDCVYVIPPNKYMTILNGALHLLEPVAPRGLRLPIDYFFRALADDCREGSIGVILSGMGSDGVLGLRAIKEHAGAVFVQEQRSAKFDGMPSSAIETGLADVIAPAEELPGRIVSFLKRTPIVVNPRLAAEDKSSSAFEKVVILLRSHTGQDFSLYKKNTIYRRIERRMGLHQIDKLTNYVRYLQENPQEVDLLFKELLIGVTSFFRDPKAWEKIKAEVIPTLLANCEAGNVVRVWVPACSTGEEAYSLAILFKEAISETKFAANVRVQIFATDLDRDATTRARAGVFPKNIAADISPERLTRFFVESERGFTVGKSIREMVIFAPQNITMDPPFTKLDLVTCRNLLIYMTPELQKKLLSLINYCLNPGGFLFLGGSETIGSLTNLFGPFDLPTRIFRRLNNMLRPDSVEFPSTFVPPRSLNTGAVSASPEPNLQTLAEKLLLQTCTPAAVLVSGEGDILYISGRTGKYIEPAAGKANWNIFAMAREGLRFDLSSAFRTALRQKDPVVVHGVRIAGDSDTMGVDVSLHAISEPEALKGLVLIVFRDVELTPITVAKESGKRTRASRAKLAKMEQELDQARMEAQRIREDMQTSQEELKSSNEEMQSTNEEIQSANEELTTSKEEMQSMNEELQTLNHELQAKVDDLSRLNSDMKNLLESTEIATLFLDNALHVRLFTTGLRKIFKLIPGDVGRPITDIASDLIYPGLGAKAEEVIRTLLFHEEVVTTSDGRWFKVRIMPYRTVENVIDGVVVTFADVTISKTLEAQLREAHAKSEQVVAAQGKRISKQYKLVNSEGGLQVKNRKKKVSK